MLKNVNNAIYFGDSFINDFLTVVSCRKRLRVDKFRYGAMMLAIILFVLPASAESINTSYPANVWVLGDTIHYEGNISDWKVVEEAIADIDVSDLRRIVINSGGGDTRLGRRLGTWVFEHNLDVEVAGGCFSSCANYVFVAGKNKIIQEGAFVGWHGDERQVEFLMDPGDNIPGFLRKELRSAILKSTPGLRDTKQLKQIINDQLEIAQESLRNERKFFDQLGITDEFAIYGFLLPKNRVAYYASGKRGWTFSISDMERLGIQDVSYSGFNPYETSSQVLEHLIVFKLR